MKTSGRLRKKAVYGPLCQQTLEAVLKRELINNFGFENMGVVADVLIQRFLAIIEEYAPLQKRLRPYQTLVLALWNTLQRLLRGVSVRYSTGLAVDKNERFGYGKRMESCRLVPVIVTLISPEELQELAEGVKLRELRPKVAPRILKEAYDQGGVLPFSTVGLLTGLHSPTAVSDAVRLFYEHNPGVVLPHSGTVFDLGRTLTHRRVSVLLKHQGLLTQEIARRINHHPCAVARYNNDDERVGRLWEEGKSAEMITFLTGLSLEVVQEYIAIRKELQRGAKSES